MEKSLLDTDMLSEVMRARNPQVVQKVADYKSAQGALTISTITVMEIVKGFHKVGRQDAIERFRQSLSSTEVLPFDQTSAEIAGRIYADLEKQGQPIGRADPMIAAIAIQNSLVLVTGNTDHYRRIQNLGYPLQLDNWR